MSDIRKLINIVEAATKPRIPGKKIGGDLYVHRGYAREAGIPEDILRAAISKLPDGFEYQVIKYNPKEQSFSFIHSPDFDTADEPVSGTSYKVRADGRVTVTKQLTDPWIYHHKWMWVPDDYAGFDVEQSKQRSKDWQSVVSKDDMSRIGKQSYWNTQVLPRLKK
jgi:hypothetical protein